jgi:hypothetical protein
MTTIDDIADDMVYWSDDKEKEEARAIVKKALSGDIDALRDVLVWTARAEQDRCEEYQREMEDYGYE